jgi:hypothetical protein
VALKSAPTPRGARSLAGRPHSSIPGGLLRCSPARARRPMPLAEPRVKVGCSFAVQARPHPSSLKPDRATHSAPPVPLYRSPCRPSAPLGAATVNLGSDQPISPTKAPSTLSCTCCCSPSCSRAPPSSHLVGAELQADATRPRHGTPTPARPRTLVSP